MEILYFDSNIVVCVKPSGILSAKDLSEKPNMQSLLESELSVKEVFPIHRLDREVSGLMVYALNKKAAATLSGAASNHTLFTKEYIALVGGIPEVESGVFEDLLFKDSAKNKTYVVKKERKGVKFAKLEYTVLEKHENAALVRVKLYTGRTHQIRVQFASRKMPLVGDRKYGGAQNEKGIALRSVYLSFNHPISGEKLTFERIPKLEELI